VLESREPVRCGTSLALYGGQNRTRAAFLEDPALSLTLAAAQRWFGVDEVTCAGVLGALVDAQVLTERNGVYRRHLPQAAVRQAA
jgi:hypothetical protein